MSGGPVSVSGPHPPIGTTPRLAPKARTGRQADPRRSPHQGPGGASLPAPSIRKRAEPGVSAKPPPQKTAGRGQTASGHGPLPRHSIQSGQKTGGSGKGRKQRRRRDGGLTELSKIPSREELLSRLLGSMQSPIANFARVIKQIAEKGGETAEAPAEETAEAAEAPAAEAAEAPAAE